MAILSEKDLVLKARDNPEYFGELYENYFDRILNYTFRRVGDFDLANDITSEVFLKAYTNIWRYKWKNIPFGAWLYRIATNEINQFFRKKSYKAETTDDLNATHLLNKEKERYDQEKNESEKQLDDRVDFKKVQEIIKVMPVKYQEVISLRYFEQKSLKEICQILNKKEGTVKSLISRGLGKIRLAW